MPSRQMLYHLCHILNFFTPVLPKKFFLQFGANEETIKVALGLWLLKGVVVTLLFQY